MRYTIGIDLGTTNCALAYVDYEAAFLSIHLFAISQFTEVGKLSALPTLPSFCYLTSEGEWIKNSFKLPWKEEAPFFVGEFAKKEGARVPTRLIQSAKSWLCNISANRRDKILPIESIDSSRRLSPIEVSSLYLSHLRDAWNFKIAKNNPLLVLEEQEIILTVPASFDEVARSLTIESASQAGFLNVTLIEEPQAAFYSWISQHEKEWQTLFEVGDTVLICDIGGGTTDFSLIEIQESEGSLFFQRMAVGDHLLLGGDNIDIALAYYLEQKINSESRLTSFESTQWLQLKSEARNAKEYLLNPEVNSKDAYSVVIQGSGSSVVGGSFSTSIHRAEIEKIILDGFFGHYPLKEALKLKKRSGLRTMGLPYEDDPSITKHLAHFLEQAHYLNGDKTIDFVLFNGGTLKPEIFQEAIEASLKTWFPLSSVKRLSPFNLDLAVARGAAYYGKVRRGHGVAIRGGLPRTYYLKIECVDDSKEMSFKALTLLARGSQEGHVYEPNYSFSLRANTPVVFHILTSHTRLGDQEGDLIEIDPAQMQELPIIQTVLSFGKNQVKEASDLILVTISIRLTEVGTIELWLVSKSTNHKWNLEFQLRNSTEQGVQELFKMGFSKSNEIFDPSHLETPKKTLELLFSKGSSITCTKIMDLLESQIGRSRKDWGMTILRSLAGSLLQFASQRKLSLEHEAKWWNLLGFFLRPGFGFALDEFKIKELWKIILSDFKGMRSPEILIQMCICFRRISGGLSKGHQMQIAHELIPMIIQKKTGKIDLTQKGQAYSYLEKIRTLASFERLDTSLKINLGNALLDRITNQDPFDSDFWALGRIGARHLLYGSLGQVVSRDIAARWIDQLLNIKVAEENRVQMIFLLGQLARKTDQRELNVSDLIINRILEVYPDESLKQSLLEMHFLTIKEQEQIFGEQFPAGLIFDCRKI